MGGLDAVERRSGTIAELALGAKDRRAWRVSLLGYLDRAIGFDLASMQNADGPTESTDLLAIGYDESYLRANIDRHIAELEASELGAAMNRVVRDTETPAFTRRDRLAMYRELMAPNRVREFVTTIWTARGGAFGFNLARTGARGRFSSRDVERLAELLPAIQLGEAYLGCGRPSISAWADDTKLSRREREIAGLIARGLQNREIAGVLRVSANTVRNHVAQIFRKAAVTTRTELVFVMTSPEAVAPGERWHHFFDGVVRR